MDNRTTYVGGGDSKLLNSLIRWFKNFVVVGLVFGIVGMFFWDFGGEDGLGAVRKNVTGAPSVTWAGDRGTVNSSDQPQNSLPSIFTLDENGNLGINEKQLLELKRRKQDQADGYYILVSDTIKRNFPTPKRSSKQKENLEKFCDMDSYPKKFPLYGGEIDVLGPYIKKREVPLGFFGSNFPKHYPEDTHMVLFEYVWGTIGYMANSENIGYVQFIETKMPAKLWPFNITVGTNKKKIVSLFGPSNFQVERPSGAGFVDRYVPTHQDYSCTGEISIIYDENDNIEKISYLLFFE